MARNRYAGTCYRCGKEVAKGEGHFEKTNSPLSSMKWRLQHAECAIKFREQPNKLGGEDGK